jgi:hypothetical protein
VKTSWIDMSRVAVFPTLDPDTIAARQERARQVHYADLRKERQRQAMRAHLHHASMREQADMVGSARLTILTADRLWRPVAPPSR